VEAPEIVANYNKGMDGVDRHDQYRQLFSLCKTHGFKKYYVKLVLALFDMAIVNAVLHFKMRWKDSEDKEKASMSRADFMQEIASKLMSKDSAWSKEDSDVVCDPFLQSSPQGTDAFCRPTGTSGESMQYIPKGCKMEAIQKYSTTLDYFKRRCQICDYEERGKKRVANVLLCLTHGIKACGVPRPPRSEEKRKLVLNGTNEPVTDFSWMCDDNKGLTCMEKFHTFYLQQQLFKTKPVQVTGNKKIMFATIRMTSDIWKRRQAALGIPLGKRGRKKKKIPTDESVDDSSNSDDELVEESNNPYINLPPTWNNNNIDGDDNSDNEENGNNLYEA